MYCKMTTTWEVSGNGGKGANDLHVGSLQGDQVHGQQCLRKVSNVTHGIPYAIETHDIVQWSHDIAHFQAMK